MKQRIGIIFGGKSGEHRVSLLSAASVIRVMDAEKYQLVYIGITRNGEWKIFHGDVDEIESGVWESTAKDLCICELKELIDFALPIVHGPYCEDGKLQGLLEMLDLPYGGCGVLASTVAMDKKIAKDIFQHHCLPVCKYTFITKEQYEKEQTKTLDEIEVQMGYPNFVKPANMGSSVGISKVKDRSSLKNALELAMKYDSRILIEEYIDCRELEVGILGNGVLEVTGVGEIIPTAEFYDYDAKYFAGGESKLSIPANISDEIKEEIQKSAVKAFQAINGEGFGRVDFFVDRKTGKLYINEINTIPGFTKFSMFPLLWQAAGLSYQEIIERIIELGYERHNAKNSW